MVKTTKDETNFINLVNRMKVLANKSVVNCFWNTNKKSKFDFFYFIFVV